MVKIGMMVSDRYEVLDKVGAGGMSDVYRAKDHKLNRFVAIKVLKQEFAENTEFRSKFRMEAQAAAGLMHPNIVNVYDVGEESGFSYIVMELVEGITLKKYIEKKARLSVKEAVSIAIQVGRGIEAAHNNHIIHRDIKPQNIIISKEGKVKVTDFGIAKAATSNTITSNVMGSVHYTSPEQVRGGFSDEKSDIYSLGITLFEMLTGRVPYNGETTVAVAIQHIQEEMPSPRDYVPEIPVSVEQIVLKCTQKSPDRRYQSAPELIEDLKKSLISPDENFVKMDTMDMVGVTRDFTSEDKRRMKQAARHDEYEQDQRSDTEYDRRYEERYEPEGYEETVSRKGSNHKKDQGRKTEKKGSSKNTKTKNGTKNTKSGASLKKNTKSSKKTRKQEGQSGLEMLTTVVVIIAAVIVGVIFIYIVGSAIGIFGARDNDPGNIVGIESQNTSVKQITMPDVLGMSEAKARETLEALNIKVTTDYQNSSEDEGTVFQTSVAAGTGLNSGDAVTIMVSSGTDGIMLPDVSGMTQAEATVLLENEGFGVRVVKENSTEVPKGNVISQDPKGDSRLRRGTEIVLTVSLGTETQEVSMPDLRGMTEETAIAAMVELGLDYSTPAEQMFSDDYAEGQVCYQNYSPGITVGSGTKVVYKVSKGPEPAVYNCSYTVQAPSDYVPGTPATLTLFATDTSTALWSVTADSFPQQINISGIDSIPYGTLYITYTVSTTESVTDEAGNVTQQTVTSQKTSEPQNVAFTKVQ
ncbi:MAG: Stk1 family PASTA domain-containing Ser/Thr kinase [Lachnospiraceae bacterium]|nr:Stk1 family PASTA domain-containing Ser/Thr kinase [Lachnospiraceae bacterium]